MLPPPNELATDPRRLAPQSDEPSERTVGTVEEVATDHRKLFPAEAEEALV